MEEPIRCYWDDFAMGWIAETTDGTCISSCAGTPELAVSQVKDIVAARWDDAYNNLKEDKTEGGLW